MRITSRTTQLIVMIALVLGTAFVLMDGIMAQDDSAEEITEDIVTLTEEAAESTADNFETFLNELTIQPETGIVSLVMIVGGVILLIAGWRVYEFIILISGFLIGASIATGFIATDNNLIELVGFILGGFIGALLSVFLYHIAVFLIGAYVGIGLTIGLANLFAVTPISAIALLIGALIGGLVMIGLSFELLVIISSFVGAQMVVQGLGLDAIWVLVLALIGIIVQLGLIRSFNYSISRRPRQPRILRRVFS